MKSYRLRESMHDDLVDHLLALRMVVTPEEKAKFLLPNFERDSHDPFLLPDMEKAVERISDAKKNDEKVAVWSDYDCDGIPGGVMLADFLRTLGLTVVHYIPHRHKEGYGLNTEGIDELHEQGVTLIITIDLGTTEHESIDHANAKKIDVIVTDHHQVTSGDIASHLPSQSLGASVRQHLPPALAVINPKRPDSRYPFDGLCGAGVAWKLIQALLIKNRPESFAEGKEKWYLDLVGIATLSDMVPLKNENRMLAHFGLQVVRRNRRPGLAALLKILKIKPAGVTEDDIGFMVSPRINAASRMDSPQIAAQLLATKDEIDAKNLAYTLNKINDERKGVVAATVKEVNRRLEGTDLTESPIIVMGNPSWRPGVLGLVANKLAERHSRPTFLWGRDYGSGLPRETEGLLRGSCRSGGAVNVVDLMSQASDLFEHFGGHHASGGFSLSQDKVHELLPRLTSAYNALLTHGEPHEDIWLDRELDLAEVPHAQRSLVPLAPFGTGNAKPLFIFPRSTISSVRMFGKVGDHLELSLTSTTSVHGTSGIAFFSNPDSFTKKFSIGDRADIVGHVEPDWRGNPRIRVVDII